MPWLYPLFPFQLLSALPTAKEPLVQKTEFVFPLAWPAAVGFHGVGPHPIPPGQWTQERGCSRNPKVVVKISHSSSLSGAPHPTQ